LAGGASLTLFGSVPAVEGRSRAVPCVLVGSTFALAAPIIHVAHDRPGAAAASFALRLGAVAASGALLSHAASGDTAGAWGAAGTRLLVLAVPVVVDAAALSFE
jgi:hypothetical protein